MFYELATGCADDQAMFVVLFAITYYLLLVKIIYIECCRLQRCGRWELLKNVDLEKDGESQLDTEMRNFMYVQEDRNI